MSGNSKDRQIERLKTELMLAKNRPEVVLSINATSEISLLSLEIAHNLINYMEKNSVPIEQENPNDDDDSKDFRLKLVKFKKLYNEMVQKKVAELTIEEQQILKPEVTDAKGE